ncbi:TPA: hypothetical protein ACGO1T_001020 [Streptococcus suis]
MKTYDQAIFDALIEKSRGLGYDTYPNLPKESANYPFVHIGEVQRLTGYSKTHKFPIFSVTVTIWGDYTNRRKIAEMVANLWLEWAVIYCGEVPLKLRETSSSYRIWEQAQSPELTLWRGDMDLEFYI